MKNLVFIFLFLPVYIFSQERIDLKNSILDSIKFFPVGDANIYNFNIKKPDFNKKILFFEFLEKKKDTAVYDLPPTYSEFKKEFLNTNFVHNNKKPGEYKLTQEEMINAKFASGDLTTNNITNLIKKILPQEVSKAITSPISYLYDKFSRKKKMERLYNDLVENEEEVYNLSLKYNQDLVSSLTGLEGEELLDFMTFCKFSYYDLVHWSPEFIIVQIKKRYGDYEYYKALE
jgi:hypothetical protein